MIVDGRIQSVTAGLVPPPAGARLIDLTNRTVMPGLIDAHVHLVGDSRAPFWRGAVDTDDYLTLLGAHNALVTLRAGFTTVRDLGSPGVAISGRFEIQADIQAREELRGGIGARCFQHLRLGQLAFEHLIDLAHRPPRIRTDRQHLLARRLG